MRGRGLMIGAVMAAAVLLASGTSWGRDGVGYRKGKQLHRIGQGLKRGQITKGEWVRLKEEQRRIQHRIWKASADGRIDARERYRIARMQKRAHRHIYQARHNRTKGYAWGNRHVRRHFYKARQNRAKQHAWGARHVLRDSWHRPKYRHGHVYFWHWPRYYHYGYKGRDYRPHYAFGWFMRWW